MDKTAVVETTFKGLCRCDIEKFDVGLDNELELVLDIDMNKEVLSFPAVYGKYVGRILGDGKTLESNFIQDKNSCSVAALESIRDECVIVSKMTEIAEGRYNKVYNMYVPYDIENHPSGNKTWLHSSGKDVYLEITFSKNFLSKYLYIKTGTYTKVLQGDIEKNFRRLVLEMTDKPEAGFRILPDRSIGVIFYDEAGNEVETFFTDLDMLKAAIVGVRYVKIDK